LDGCAAATDLDIAISGTSFDERKQIVPALKQSLCHPKKSINFTGLT
jgi:hypothetical protein